MSDRSRNNRKFLNIPYSDARYLVYANATYYPGFVRIYIPNKPYPKLQDGLELSTETPVNQSRSSFTESDIERSIRRTRKVIKDYIFCNNFSLFVTFTFRDDRQDVDKCKTKMSNWLKNQRKRKGGFEYLIVPEFHKDKKAIHFHALIDGYAGNVLRAVHGITGKPIKQAGRDIYDIPSYTLGFTNAQRIEVDSYLRAGFYLMKYVTKDMPVFMNKNRYWASRGLKKPEVEHNPEPWYESALPDREYIVDNGKILEFDAGNNELIDIYLEARK